MSTFMLLTTTTSDGVCFFFQAEDGIRDGRVTGVQTCALPISAMAGAIFDGYLCSAEYLLYGPTPYAEVLELARDLRGTAERSGALRAAAFARALSGEAALLSGDLDLA